MSAALLSPPAPLAQASLERSQATVSPLCPTPPARNEALAFEAARPGDVERIVSLLRGARGSCLPLPPAEVRARLPEFEVARAPSGRVAACAALRRETLRAELRCLVVDPAWRGAGVGRVLVERTFRRAKKSGFDLFCVSRCPAWFEALGFERLPPEFVPARPGAERGRHALVRRRETPCPTPERNP